MRVAIVGAGIAGLTTAKVLLQAGHQVDVFDKAPDVGGVWSRSRRYPGVTTQSPGRQYSFSDYPMPKSYPEWPTGAQVQEYLASYAAAFGVDRVLRLETTVDAVVPDGPGWSVTSSRAGAGSVTESYDRVIVANGVFCEPAVPQYPGVEEFTAAGGTVQAGTEFLELEDARDKNVLVVGYGKSACDVAVAISEVAARTDVIARQLLWKIPRKVAGKLNFKMLLMTRMGEALFRYRYVRGFEKFLHGPGNGLRRSMLNSIGDVSVKQFGLERLGLVPGGTMEDIVKGAIGLASEGFFEGVESGTIAVHRDQVITRLFVEDGHTHAELADGSRLRADLVVCATGFKQEVPFLDAVVQKQLFDERGNFMLYRQIQPLGVPGLYFNGYNSSFFSPLNAELAALWIAADLAGALPLPTLESRRQEVVAQLAFLDEALDRHHCRGTKIIPFSMHNADEVLVDLDLQISKLTRAVHWLAPVDPTAYRKVAPVLLRRLAALPPTSPLSAVEEVASPEETAPKQGRSSRVRSV
ncbi:NAD(P)/FAD-dependent oxidoreductase [Pseudonocardia kujensis]|uniref:flavin-containing monooxygenase n=1 Tax=Pseudonocardia kujensis TaxID=1128675 RepID=UPI001E627D0C|nr:NAD(P)/FAD-dependent oxidoreductase [Pseudonocardia kujensis]MCE0764596.1 NAD(P)/FAD-dependent oxidoreductase [Pseudonocardia kujensis]